MEDWLLDQDGDLRFDGDDIATGESTEQHQALLLKSNKGDFKESPTASVGLAGWLKDQDANGMLAEIKSEFEKDGMTVNNIQFSNDQLRIDAYYQTSPDTP